METIYLKSSAIYLNDLTKYEKVGTWERKDLFENGEFKFLKGLKFQSKNIIGVDHLSGLFSYKYKLPIYKIHEQFTKGKYYFI